MNLKKILTVLLLTFIFGVAQVASAQNMTIAQKQALIAQIQQQLIQLETQLAQMLAQQQGSASWCYTFNNNLGYASSTTNDVVELHLALQKDGISYSPDDIVTYANGTAQAVMQFQTKYGISPQTGYVGPLTKTKLNQLYGCNSYQNTPTNNTGYNYNNTTSCTPNWQCSGFGSCYNGQQTQTCTDYNYCGTTINEPTTTQYCYDNTNNNNNNNNTNANTCSANCILQSDGIFAMDCYGNITKCDSGKTCQKTYNTSYTYNSGSVQTVQTLTGAQCTTVSSCVPNWQCSGFGSCASGQQTQTCTDSNNCGVLTDKPATTQSCVSPTVTLHANNSQGNLATIMPGQSLVLSWSSANTASCVAGGSSRYWSGVKALTGSETVNATLSTVQEIITYSLTCTGPTGSATSSVAVTFAPAVLH